MRFFSNAALTQQIRQLIEVLTSDGEPESAPPPKKTGLGGLLQRWSGKGGK